MKTTSASTTSVIQLKLKCRSAKGNNLVVFEYHVKASTLLDIDINILFSLKNFENQLKNETVTTNF